ELEVVTTVSSHPFCAADPLPTIPDGGSRALGALPLEDELVVPGGAERGDARCEDLHQPPAVRRVLAHDLLVGVPGLVVDAEERRTRILSKPHEPVLEALSHQLPLSFDA